MSGQEEGPEAPSEPAGWEQIREWTGGLEPDSVPALDAARGLELVYPLLNALVGRNTRDFVVRAATIECIVGADRARLTSADLSENLYWLDDRSRDTVLRVLRHSGWLEYDSASGTALTDAGRWAYDVLSFLHRKLREDELTPSIESLRHAMQLGMDPVRSLLSMRGRLVALREQIEYAQASYSEVVLRRAAQTLDQALRLSEQIREILDRVALDHLAARGIVRDIHDLLSRLHGRGAELHRGITEVGRQYIRLTAGLTVEQIVSALMGKNRSDLAEAGRAALFPVYVPAPLLTTEAVAHAAEVQTTRERVAIDEVDWVEAEEAPRADDAAEVPADVRALLVELAAIEADRGRKALADFVPRADKATSFLRASLLSLVNQPGGGGGVSGALGTLDLEVTTEGDGWPEALEGSVLSLLTPGAVTAKGEA